MSDEVLTGCPECGNDDLKVSFFHWNVSDLPARYAPDDDIVVVDEHIFNDAIGGWELDGVVCGNCKHTLKLGSDAWETMPLPD